MKKQMVKGVHSTIVNLLVLISFFSTNLSLAGEISQKSHLAASTNVPGLGAHLGKTKAISRLSKKEILGLYPPKIAGTRNHAHRVAALARIIAVEMVKKHLLDQGLVEQIYRAALAHDLGKSFSEEMMDAVNSSATDPGVRSFIKTHVDRGAMVMAREMVVIDDPIMMAALKYHHEPWRVENDIERLCAEIVYCADCIDASQDVNRPYKNGEITAVGTVCGEINRDSRISVEVRSTVMSTIGVEMQHRNVVRTLAAARAGSVWAVPLISREPAGIPVSPMGECGYELPQKLEFVRMPEMSFDLRTGLLDTSGLAMDEEGFRIASLVNKALMWGEKIIEGDKLLEFYWRKLKKIKGDRKVVLKIAKGLGVNAAHRTVGGREEIILDLIFVENLLKYEINNPTWAPAVLFQRLFHEFGHSNERLNNEQIINEEVVLINMDVKLIELYKNAGNTQYIIDGMFKLLKGRIDFRSGYYYYLLVYFSSVPDGESRIARIKEYLRGDRARKESVLREAESYAKRQKMADDYKRRSANVGGKGLGLEDLRRIREEVQKLTGAEVEVPRFRIIYVNRGWREVLKNNARLVWEGDYINTHRDAVKDQIRGGNVGDSLPLLREYVASNPARSAADLDQYIEDYLSYLAGLIRLPRTITIGQDILEIKGPIMVRTSGMREDQFDKSFAGVFSSYRADGPAEVRGLVLKAYRESIKEIWRTEGEQLTQNGMAIVLQEFVESEKSGVVMTRGDGRVSIEGVLGRPATVVKPNGVSSTIFDCDIPGAVSPEAVVGFNLFQCFSNFPSEIDTAEGLIERMKNRDELEAKWLSETTEVRGIRSPFTEEEIRKTALVARAIEQILGYPVDLEFAFSGGKLYLFQKRPRVGVTEGERIPLSETKLQVKTIAAGKPFRSEKPLPVVIFRGQVLDAEVAELNTLYGEGGYIKVQLDVISRDKDKIPGQKILLDPDSGSRNSHNMVHYRDGLGCGGDFVYMAGAALKPFLRSLNYREMICGGGILISEELVMVESNGDDDYGGMYVEGRQDSSRFIVNDDLNVMLKGFSSEQERGPREESDLLGEYDRVIREFPLFAEFDYEKLFFLKELFEALMARDSGEEILSGDRFEDIFERYFLRFGNEGVSSFEEKLRAAFDLYDFAPLWDSVFDSTKMRVFEMFMRIYKKCRILSEAKRVKREESEDVISDSGTKDFRVLIVDDEEIVSEPLSIYLGEISFTSFSYDIRTMRNTSEAIEWILDNRPQMIFLDNEIRGSGISGERFILEHVLPAIRSLDDYHPCIVLMTGYLTDKLIYLARDYGVRLLHKPFNLLTDIKPIADDTIRNHLAEKKPREAAGRAGTRDAMLAAIGCRAVSSGV